VERKIRERVEKWRAQLDQLKMQNEKLKIVKSGGQMNPVIVARKSRITSRDSSARARPEWRGTTSPFGPGQRNVAKAISLERGKIDPVLRAGADEIDVLPLIENALAENKIVALPRFVPETSGYTAFQVRNLALDLCAGEIWHF